MKAVCIHLSNRKDDQIEQTQQLMTKIIQNSFITQAVCNFSSIGTFTISIDTKLVDETDVQWNTTAKETIKVTVNPQQISTRLSIV